MWYPHVASALHVVAPIYHQRRQSNTARMINPIPYRADSFGHKLHIDQNENLAMYGVTHDVAIDGHSRFIPAGSLVPIKNYKTIYERIFWYVSLKLTFIFLLEKFFDK